MTKAQRITRRKALSAIAAAPAAVALGANAIAAGATGEAAALTRLWISWCLQLAEARRAHLPALEQSEAAVLATDKLHDLTRKVIATDGTSADAICIKLALWKWYRHDFAAGPTRFNPCVLGWKQIDRDVLAVLAAYEALASAATIDFDGIAEQSGLRIWRDGCSEEEA